MLEEVVVANRSIKGKHRDLQRITIPYANLLGVMDKESSGNDSMDL